MELIIFQYFSFFSEALNMYQVRRIEGKGLGCVASIDILQGSLIMSENPQIPNVGCDNILAVWEFYQRMSENHFL